MQNFVKHRKTRQTPKPLLWFEIISFCAWCLTWGTWVSLRSVYGILIGKIMWFKMSAIHQLGKLLQIRENLVKAQSLCFDFSYHFLLCMMPGLRNRSEFEVCLWHTHCKKLCDSRCPPFADYAKFWKSENNSSKPKASACCSLKCSSLKWPFGISLYLFQFIYFLQGEDGGADNVGHPRWTGILHQGWGHCI